MSNGRESVNLENEIAVVAVSTEVLQESHEEPENGQRGKVVNSVQIDISERNSFLQDDGEYSGQSSAAATPLERSQEVTQSSEETLLPGTNSLPLLKEWNNTLINLLARIPVQAQKGFSTFDLKLTCISTISEEILVIGTNVGVVYWYNRRTDLLDRLRCEGLDPVTSLGCISTVDYMVAAGNQAGLVTIFQIPKDSPQDSASKNNATPEAYYERKTKKSQRFHVQDLHKGAVTALEWSKNGMKLFSGDQSGHVVLTDIDYDLVQIRSSILLCENYEIVQLSYARKNLLICSTFRSIIYSLENKVFSKVGSLERKLGKFGGLIVSSAWEESPKVYSVRPGARLWVADLSGVVQHTIKFKELILSGSQSEIHVIKPTRSPRQLSISQQQQQDIQFTRVFRFMKDYLVTYYKDILHIVDARNTVVLGICKELRSILDVAVNKDEIFILESSRNVIRLSAKPDKFSSLTSTNFFANFSTSSNSSNSVSASSTNSSSTFRNQQSDSSSTSSGMKQTLPDIMSASIADFRFPQEPINFLTSKFKETSGRVIPKINPLLNTIKTVIEADVDIENGQKLLESGMPVMIASENGDITGFDLFTSPPPILPEEPVFVPEPERFQKITNLPFEDVVVEVKATAKKTKRSSRNSSGTTRRSGKTGSSAPSEVASDSVSVSSAFSNTSGSENNACTTGGKGGAEGGAASSSSSTSARKLSFKSDVTFSSGSNSGSEGLMTASEHPHMYLKDQLGIPLALSQSWSVGTLLPNKSVTTEELHLKEELLARRLKWPELLPESISADGLFDEPAVILAATSGRNHQSSSEENNCWQVNLHRNNNNNNAEKRRDRSSELTLVGPRFVSGGGGSGEENTDTDSRTLSFENGSSFGTVIEREVLRSVEVDNNNPEESNNNSTSGHCSTDEGDVDEDDDDDNEDTYYMDIYTRYRSKDSHSVSSFNSVLSFGPPSGSSHVSGGAAALGSIQNQINGNTTASSNNASLSTAYPVEASSGQLDEELGNSKEKSSDTTSTTATSSSTTEETDSIVEAKIVTNEYWRKWRLPSGGITQLALCDKYIVCLTCKGTVCYSTLDSINLHWKTTNYSASAITISPCGTVVWRVYRGDLFSLTNPSADCAAPIGQGGEQWSKLTQRKDVATASVQRSFGWIVKQDGSLEFCTGLLETRLIPYFEKVLTPWPIQDVTCCGHKLWALTSDGRIVYRTGTSDHNPKGIDWLEVRWSSNDITAVCSISCANVRDDGVSSVWFSDTNSNLYFTSDERDSKGAWVPWKVAVSDSIIYPSHSTQQSKSVLLSSLREQVSKSFKSLVTSGAKNGLKLCSSKSSVWFSGPEKSILYGNRSTVTGHCWKPLRIDQGIVVPSTWTHIYANSIYHRHGILWISDSKGNLFHMPPDGGRVQQLDLPMFTDGQIRAIAPAPEALWTLTSSGDIHGRCEITTTDSVGKSWRQLSLSTLNSTQFVHISCGSEVSWAVDDKGEVYMRIGSLRPPGAQDMSPAWNKVEKSTVCFKGIFTKIYVGANGSMVWALDSEKQVYARQAVFPDYPIGTGWLLVKGVYAEMLAISDSAVWALSTNGSIFRRYGITKTNFVGDYWHKIPGNASSISVSLCDELWALSSEGYLLKHSKTTLELKGWGSENWERTTLSSSSKVVVLDDEDDEWELVDNSEILNV